MTRRANGRYSMGELGQNGTGTLNPPYSSLIEAFTMARIEGGIMAAEMP